MGTNQSSWGPSRLWWTGGLESSPIRPGAALVPLSHRHVRPLHTLSALVVAVALGMLVCVRLRIGAAVRRCRRSHPAACLAAVLAVGFVLWPRAALGTFLLSIAGPVLRESSLP